MNKLLIARISLLLVILGLGISSCSDNPVVPDDEEIEAAGLVVLDNGMEIVRAEKGIVTGQFEVKRGSISGHYTLNFLDENGDILVITDPDYTPGETIADPSVAEIVRDEPGEWNFHIRGLKEGSTTIRLTIKHGGHDDFISPEIPIIVTP